MVRKNQFKRYRCKVCNIVIANYGSHLQNWHDEIDRFTVHSLDWSNPNSLKILNEYFEQVDKDTQLSKINYNPRIEK